MVNIYHIQTAHIIQQSKKDPVVKWAGKLNGHFFKERMQIANKYMKRCSTSLIIRKMQIKTTVRYHFTPVRMAIIKKNISKKCRQGCGEQGTLVHCWWKCKLVQPVWKTGKQYGGFSKN